jgi:hypothetical protein
MFSDFYQNIRTGRMSQAQVDSMLSKAEADARKNGMPEASIEKMKREMLSVVGLNGGVAESIATVRIPGVLNDQNTSTTQQAVVWVAILAVVGVVLYAVLKGGKWWLTGRA